jgi:hypothetical protein
MSLKLLKETKIIKSKIFNLIESLVDNNISDIKYLIENQYDFRFPVHIINEQEFEKGLKEAYELYSRIEFEPWEDDYDEDEDDSVKDRYPREDDEDPNKHITFERFKEENLSAIHIIVHTMLSKTNMYYYPKIQFAKENLGSRNDIIDVYIYFKLTPLGGMRYDVLVLFNDRETDQKWVVISDAVFDSREGYKPKVNNGHILAKMDRKEFSLNLLPFELKDWQKNYKARENQELLQKALKRKVEEHLSPLAKSKREELGMDLENIEGEGY